MSKQPPLLLGDRDLDALFPFRLVVDARAHLVAVGPALARFAPELEAGDRFVDHLIVERPGLTVGHLVEWFEEPDPEVLFVLRRRSGGWLLRGQWVASPDRETFTFLGTPALRDESDLSSAGLQIKDFAPSDPIGTYLALAQSFRRSLNETHSRWERHRARSRDLESRLVRADQIRHERSAFLRLLARESVRRLESHPEGSADPEARRLAHAVVELTEVESGQAQLNCRDYSPRELVREVLTRVRGSLEGTEELDLNGGVEASLPESVYGPFESQVKILTTILAAAAKTAQSRGLSLKLRRDRELGSQFGFRAEISEDRGSISEELATQLTTPDGGWPENEGKLGGANKQLLVDVAIARQWATLLGGRFELNLAIQGFQRLFIRMPWANERAVRDGLRLPFPERAMLVGSPSAKYLSSLEAQLGRLGSSTRWAGDLGQAMEELREAGAERAFGVVFVDEGVGEDWEPRLRRLLLTVPRPHPTLVSVSERLNQEEQAPAPGQIVLPLPDVELWRSVAEARRAAQPAVGSEQSAPSLDSLRVLLVDNDLVSARVIQRVLTRLGAQVEVARDGHQAVEAWDRLRHDLLLVDPDLPTVDGAETIRRIRSLESGRQHTRILGLCHPDPQEKALRLHDAGADGMIPKPLRADSLERALDAWLRPAA